MLLAQRRCQRSKLQSGKNPLVAGKVTFWRISYADGPGRGINPDGNHVKLAQGIGINADGQDANLSDKLLSILVV